MPQVTGITTVQDAAGNITSVTINMEKHRDTVMPLLEKLGVIEKSEFDQECERAISVDELRNSLCKKIYAVWGK